MSNILIQPVKYADLPILWEINQAVMTLNVDPNRIFPAKQDEFNSRLLKSTTLVARTESGQVVGFLDYSPIWPEEMYGKQWSFEIAVSKDAQGSGIGKKLIGQMLTNAQQAEVAKISLRVLGSNPRAISFYEHLGFVREGHYRKEFHLNGKWVDDYQYARFYPYS